MRYLIIISILLCSISVDAQGNRTSLKKGIQKCLDALGDPIENCCVKTDANGEQYYISCDSIGLDADWYKTGGATPDDNTQDIYHEGDVHIGDATMAMPGKFNVLDGASKFYIEDEFGGMYPHLYLGGSSSAVAGVFRRLTSSASIYFGENTDTGGAFFRGSGGLTHTATNTSGQTWAYIGNTAGSGTSNKARLGLGAHSGYDITVAPYIESFNVANDAGLAFGTYDGSLSEKMRILPNGNVGIGETNPGSKLTVIGRIDQRFPTVALNNVMIGNGAGNLSGTGDYNIGIGRLSLQSFTSGFSNVGIGDQSLTANTEGFDNYAIGTGALQSLTDGDQNTALGSYAMQFGNPTGSVGIGYQALRNGNYNQAVGIGYATATAGGGFYGTIIGGGAGQGVTGQKNVLIGAFAGYQITTGATNVMIGNEAGGGLGNVSNKLVITNATDSTPLIYGDFSTNTLDVNGLLTVDGNLQPLTDNTRYIGRNDDDAPKAYKGLILKDQTTGTYYRIEINSGAISVVDLTD